MAREDRSSRRGSLRDKVRQRAEENKYTGGSSYIRLPEGRQFFKPKKGTHLLDHICYEVTVAGVVPDGKSKEIVHKVGELEYARTIFVHRGVGAEDKPYLCPRTIKKPCPICEERARLQKLPNVDEETVRELKPQIKDIFNVIDQDNPDDGVQLFEFSYANYRESLEEEIREGNEDWAAFADDEEGYTVKARFSEETFAGNKYLEVSRIDFDKRRPVKKELLDQAIDLDTCLVVLPYDKLKAIFWEADTGEDEPIDDKKNESEPEKSERGSSRRTEPEPEPEPEPEKERSSSRRSDPDPESEKSEKSERGSSRRTEPEPEKEKSKDGACPCGHEFGKDCDEKPECHKCPTEVWEKCRDEKDKLNPPRRR